jgi:hypothetical protein
VIARYKKKNSNKSSIESTLPIKYINTEEKWGTKHRFTNSIAQLNQEVGSSGQRILACSWRVSSLAGDLVEHKEDLHGEGRIEPISTRAPASTFRLISATTVSYQSSSLATTRQERHTKELAELGHHRSGGRELDDGAVEDGGLADREGGLLQRHARMDGSQSPRKPSERWCSDAGAQ